MAGSNVKVLCDGNVLELEEIQGLPISISKSTDAFTKIVGAEGSVIDSPIKTLSIPATKSNDKALGFPAMTQSRPVSKDKNKDLYITSRGTPVFCGVSKFKKSTRDCFGASTYQMELLGDGASVWDLLEDCLLCELDIGEILHSENNVKGSWSGSYDTGWSGIFAPAIYGALTTDKDAANPLPEKVFTTSDFRYHIYYRAIIDAIFVKKLGYCINSKFFDSDFFKNWVYNFGVGDQIFDYIVGVPRECVASYTTGVNYNYVSGQDIVFGTTISDDCDEFDGVSTFTASRNTEYTFNIQGFGGVGFLGIEIKINGVSQGPIVTSPIGIFSLINETATFTLSVGDTVTICALGNGTGALGVVTSGFATDVENLTFNIAGMLHCNPVKDFLRGISHQFNLVWNFNNVTRQLYVEPRFNYTLPDGTKCEGYYNSLSQAQPLRELCLDCSTPIDLTCERPFGDKLYMSFKETKSGFIENKIRSSDLNPLFGTCTHLSESENKTEDKFNTYFTHLFLNSVPEICSTDLPFFVDDYDATDGLGEPTYEYEPTGSYLYRGLASIQFKGQAAGIQFFQPPLMAQNLCSNNINPNPVGIQNIDFAATYSNQNITIGGTTLFQVKGLVSIFYQQYFSIIRNAQYLEAEFLYKFFELSAENFRRLNKVTIGANSDPYILIKISNFNPSDICPIKMKLVKYCEVKDSDKDLTTHYKIN